MNAPNINSNPDFNGCWSVIPGLGLGLRENEFDMYVNHRKDLGEGWQKLEGKIVDRDYTGPATFKATYHPDQGMVFGKVYSEESMMKGRATLPIIYVATIKSPGVFLGEYYVTMGTVDGERTKDGFWKDHFGLRTWRPEWHESTSTTN